MSTIDQEAGHLRAQEVENINKTREGHKIPGNDYPAHYFPHKSAEDRLSLLSQAGQIADTIGIQKPSFDRTLIELAETKKKEVELFNFEQWIAGVYDQNDPAENEILSRIYPAFKAKREQFIIEKYELAKRHELLKLFGPRDQDDLILMYMIANKQITIPSLDMKGQGQDVDTDPTKSGEFARGLFNVNKYCSTITPMATYKAGA